CISPMAYFPFFRRSNHAKFPPVVRLEKRIVSETAFTGRGFEDAAVEFTFVCAGLPAGDCERNDRSEVCRAVMCVPKRLQKPFIIFHICRMNSCISRRINSRGSIQCIHAKAGIIAYDGHAERVSRSLRFEHGVPLERIFGLL